MLPKSEVSNLSSLESLKPILVSPLTAPASGWGLDVWFREITEWTPQIKASWLWSLPRAGSARAHPESTLLESMPLSQSLALQSSCDTVGGLEMLRHLAGLLCTGFPTVRPGPVAGGNITTVIWMHMGRNTYLGVGRRGHGCVYLSFRIGNPIPL